MKCEVYTKDGEGPRCQKTATAERYGKNVCGTHLHSRYAFFESNASLGRKPKQEDVRMQPYSSSKRLSSKDISEENVVIGRRSQRERAEREREEQKMIKGQLDAERRRQRETNQAMSQVQSRLSGLSLAPTMGSLNISTSSNNNSSYDDEDIFEQTNDYDESPPSSQEQMEIKYRKYMDYKSNRSVRY